MVEAEISRFSVDFDESSVRGQVVRPIDLPQVADLSTWGRRGGFGLHPFPCSPWAEKFVTEDCSREIRYVIEGRISGPGTIHNLFQCIDFVPWEQLLTDPQSPGRSPSMGHCQ